MRPDVVTTASRSGAGAARAAAPVPDPPSPGGVAIGSTAPLIRGVECTQAVQHFPLGGVGLDRAPNSVPLIAGKDLFLRVFLSRDDRNWTGGRPPAATPVWVRAELPATGDEFIGPASELRSVLESGREVTKGSLNVAIPDHRCHAMLHLNAPRLG